MSEQLDFERESPVFTMEQVTALRAYQADETKHAYTCDGCSPAKKLSVYEGGMVCWYCGYVQRWAHKVIPA